MTKTKKRFGQHFLNNQSVSQRIAETLNADEGTIIEIGPGEGVLTEELYKLYGKRLFLVEIDRDLIDNLNYRFPGLRKNIINADFLKIDLSQFKAPIHLIGNFPYNISSQIVFKAIENRTIVKQLVGMFQKEMAQRVTATHGNKSFGVITVFTQLFYKTDYLFEVPPEYFNPPPKVHSAIIKLQRNDIDEIGVPYKRFRAVVKHVFSQRRKMLRNTLKAFIKGDMPVEPEFMTQRPEQLSIQELIDLVKWIDGYEA